MTLIKCPECGKKANHKNGICNNCGYPLSEIEIKNNKNSKKLYILFYSIIVILIIGFGALFILKNNLFKNSSENYVACFEKRDICIGKEELYEMVSNTTNTDIKSLIYLLDEKLLKDIYPNESEDVQKQVDDTLKQYREQFDDEEKYLQALSSYGFNSLEEAKRDLSLNFYQSKAIEDYAKKQVNQKKIEQYYEDKINGDMRVSHILIAPNINSEMTEEEKNEANSNGIEKVKNIIKELDNGADFSKLAEQYSEDSSTKNKGGDLGYINKDDVVEEFFDAASQLKVNEYSKRPVETVYGYHIILKTAQKKKPTLKEEKEKIILALAKDLMDSDDKFSIKALKEFRNEYGLKVYDDNLKVKYEEYLKTELSGKEGE